MNEKYPAAEMQALSLLLRFPANGERHNKPRSALLLDLAILISD